MEKETDLIVFFLRFIFGIIIGCIFVLPFWFLFYLDIPLYIGGIFILIIGICSAVWGDKFIFWFPKIFKALRYM